MKPEHIVFFSLLSVSIACSSPAGGHMPDAAVIPDPAALTIAVSATKRPILQGTSENVEVTVTRLAGQGAVAVEPVGLPAGVTFDPVTIDAGATSATLTLHAAADAPHSLPTTVHLRGTMGDIQAETDVTVTVYGPPGSLDTSFSGGRVILPAGASDDAAYAVAVQADGKIVLGGIAAEHHGDFALIRLDRDGQLDPTFGTGGRVLTDFAGRSDAIHALAIQPDGKIVAAGVTTGATTSNDFAVARYLPSGELDPSFGTGGKVVTVLGNDSDNAHAVLIQPQDGKIIVGGDSNRGTTSSGVDFALVRYTATGALDPMWGTDGVVLTPIESGSGGDSIYALAIQPLDGEARILAAGGEGDFKVTRYRWNGVLDTSFASGGKADDLTGSTIGSARAVTVTPSGTIALAGNSQNDFALVQLTQEGALDPFFGTGGKAITAINAGNADQAQALAVDTGGKLLVAGWTYVGGSTAGNFVLARYLTNGDLDPAFGGTGMVVTEVAEGTKSDLAMAVSIQVDDRVPTHRVITAGYASVSNTDFAVTRHWR